MTDITTMLARSRVPLGFVFGAAVVWLAHPTFLTLAIGGAIATSGELVRVWAAGHIEKGREVTRSGPYHLTRHPLYVGSALIGVGVAIASARWSAAALVAAYLLSTITSAIRHEEANMRAAFGERYDAYPPTDRSFSAERAFRNKEHKAIVGLLAVAAVFAFKASRHL
jgi:protein-S-isoprenylcysteine O-methyltransferase Ste14